MVERARLVIVAATSDKVGHVAAFAIGPVSAIDQLVLASAPSGAQRRAFVDAGTQLHVA